MKKYKICEITWAGNEQTHKTDSFRDERYHDLSEAVENLDEIEEEFESSGRTERKSPRELHVHRSREDRPKLLTMFKIVEFEEPSD